MRRNILDCYDAAHMYLWLCSLEREMRYLGGHTWPTPNSTSIGEMPAAPPSLSTTPDAWRPDAPPI